MRRKPPSTVWLVTGITLLAAVLRLYRIGASGLWTDEAYSVWVAMKHSMPEIWYWTRAVDAHPPLYYWLLHLWLRAGDSEGALRLLSVIYGTLTVPVAFGIGRIIGGRSAGIATAFLVSISPVNVQYSQEVRMYSLLPLAAAISILAMAWLLRPRGFAGAPTVTTSGAEIPAGLTMNTSHARPVPDTAAWLGYVVGTAGALWVQYTAVFLPLSANMIVLLSWSRLVHRPFFMRNWIFAQIMVVVLCIPLAPLYLHQSSGPNFPPIGPLSLVEVLTGLTPDLLPSYRSLVLFRTMALLEIALVVIVVGFSVRTWRRNRQRLFPALILWLGPLAGEVIASVLWRPVLSSKVLIWTTIPFYVIIAAAFAELRARPAYRAAALTIPLVIAISGLSINYWMRPEYEGWRPVAEYLAEAVDPGDVILFNDSYVELPFDYYFRRYRIAAVELGIPANFGANSVREPIMTRADAPALRLLANGHRRLWLVYSHYWYTDPFGLVPETLGQVAHFTDARSFPSWFPIVVQLYERRP